MGGDLDGKAEVLETLDEALGLPVLAPAVEVLGAEVLIEHPAPEHVVGGGQDRGRHGSNRRLRSALGAQAMELRCASCGPPTTRADYRRL